MCCIGRDLLLVTYRLWPNPCDLTPEGTIYSQLCFCREHKISLMLPNRPPALWGKFLCWFGKGTVCHLLVISYCVWGWRYRVIWELEEGRCSVTRKVLWTVSCALSACCCHLLLMSSGPAMSAEMVYYTGCQILFYFPILGLFCFSFSFLQFYFCLFKPGINMVWLATFFTVYSFRFTGHMVYTSLTNLTHYPKKFNVIFVPSVQSLIPF